MNLLRRISAFMIVAGLIVLATGDVQRQAAVRAFYWLPNAAVPSDAVINTIRLGLLLTVGGGCLAFAAGARRALPARYIFLWFLLAAYGTYLAAKSITWGELLTVTGYSMFAPGFAVASLLLFAGAAPALWRPLMRAIALGVFAVAALVFWQILHTGSMSREQAFAGLFAYASILEAAALLPVGLYAGGNFALRLTAWLPLLALALAAVMLQTRLMAVEIVCLLTFFVVLRRHAGEQRRRSPAAGLLALAAVAAATVYGVAQLSSGSTLADAARAFWDRRYEDTRSGQASAFFDKISPGELAVGRGIPRLGDYSGQGVAGIDCGYINILFVAGVPGLLLFSALHLAPALRCLRIRLNPVDAACAASVLTYAVRLLSSTVPDLRPNYLILLLMMGRCAALAASRTCLRQRAQAVDPAFFQWYRPEPGSVAGWMTRGQRKSPARSA